MRRGDSLHGQLPSLGPYWWTPLGLLSAALVVLLAVPMIVGYRVRHLRARLTDGTDRALVLVNDFEAALATELLARDEMRFQPTRSADSTIVTSMVVEHRDEAALDSLVRDMNPETIGRYAILQDLDRQRRDYKAFESRDSTPAVYQNGASPSLALRVLEAAERLQQPLDRSSTAARDRIRTLERLDTIFAAVLVPIAFLSVVLVVSIGRRTLSFAHALETEHAALRQATAARSALLRGVTHDVKNPLGAALGYADLLEETAGPLTQQQRHFVSRMRRLLSASLETISDLLDLARTDAGALRVMLVDTNVSSMIQEVVEDYRGEAAEKGQAIDVDVPLDIHVRTDATRARQVLGNLISNAVKYTPKNGRILIRVTLPADGDPNAARGLAAIEVHDSGPGIPRAFRERVFDEFFRLDSPEQVAGTGIGLTISKRLSLLLQGDLTVSESSLGGARFTLWLPLERRAAGSSASTVHEGLPVQA